MFGNGPVELMTSNALLLLELMGRSDIPVAAGEHKAREDPVLPPYAAFVHGKDGLGNTNQRKPAGKPIEQSAAEFLVSQCAAAPGEISVLAIGPLSNLRAAIELVCRWMVVLVHPNEMSSLISVLTSRACLAHAGRQLLDQRQRSDSDGRCFYC